MKLAFSLFCIMHLAFVSAGIFTRDELQATKGALRGSNAQAPQATGSLNQGRQRPLFARRGQYERQRIHVPKPKVVPVTPKVEAKPVKPGCSQLTQSCLPQSGCCDPHASCHCRFFNAICFCRLYKNKT